MFADTQSIKVVKYLLNKRNATQMDIEAGTGVSHSYINEIIKKMHDANIISRPHFKGLVLTDQYKLIIGVSLDHPLVYVRRYKMKGDKRLIEHSIAKAFNNKIEYAFTLLSAAKHYGLEAEGSQISIYVLDKAEELKKAYDAIEDIGGSRDDEYGTIEIYPANKGVLYDKKESNGAFFASREQLILDLYNHSSLSYLGSELLKKSQDKVVLRSKA